LKHTSAILPEQYPRFTLIRQAWGSVTLGLEALKLFVPEVGTIPAAGGLALIAGHGQQSSTRAALYDRV